MQFTELLLLALSVSMDAFAVSVCKGLCTKQSPLKTGLVCGAWFGSFQAIMPTIGFFLGSLFANLIESFDHWVAFGLLAIIGFNMLKEAFEKEEEVSCDVNGADLAFKTMFIMAIATSIDALAVGISFSCMGYTSLVLLLYPLVAIGVVSSLMTAIGLTIGVKFGKAFAERLRAELWGGIILIGIGVKVLVEHLS